MNQNDDDASGPKPTEIKNEEIENDKKGNALYKFNNTKNQFTKH